MLLDRSRSYAKFASSLSRRDFLRDAMRERTRRLTSEINGAALLRRPATEGSELERRVGHHN